MTKIEVRGCVRWSYRTMSHVGICVVDGELLTMYFVIRLDAPCEVPDVLEIESVCKGMTASPNTLEGYTAILATKAGVAVHGYGWSRSHGVIGCLIFPGGN